MSIISLSKLIRGMRGGIQANLRYIITKINLKLYAYVVSCHSWYFDCLWKSITTLISTKINVGLLHSGMNKLYIVAQYFY